MLVEELAVGFLEVKVAFSGLNPIAILPLCFSALAFGTEILFPATSMLTELA
jgi:hypothetical protein